MVSHYHWNGDSHVSLLPIQKELFGDTSMLTLPEDSPYSTQFIGIKFWLWTLGNLAEQVYGSHGALHSKTYFTRVTNLPWLNKNIVKAIKRRNCLYRKQECANEPRLTLKYIQLQNQVTAKLRQAKWNYFRRVKDASSRDFWKSLKYLNKKHEKANALNTYIFLNLFLTNLSSTNIKLCTRLLRQNCSAEMMCTEVEVFNMLNTLDTTKVCGPDGITGKMLNSSVTPMYSSYRRGGLHTKRFWWAEPPNLYDRAPPPHLLSRHCLKYVKTTY